MSENTLIQGIFLYILESGEEDSSKPFSEKWML
jgi:hypothetical protein